MDYSYSRYNVIVGHRNNTYLWNTFSDAFIKIGEDALRWIQAGDLSDSSALYHRVLSSNGCIIPSGYSELNQILSDEKLYLDSSEPASLPLVIAPGLGCNYKCHYCFERPWLNRGSSMSEETEDAIVQLVERTIEAKPSIRRIHVTWFGGEPLLYPNTLASLSGKLINLCNLQSLRYSASIITNGRLLTPSVIDLLVEHKTGQAQITLDGLEKRYCLEKGVKPRDFKCVLENLSAAADQMPVGVRINTDGTNKEEVLSLVDIIAQRHKSNLPLAVYLAPIQTDSIVKNLTTAESVHALEREVSFYCRKNHPSIRFEIKAHTCRITCACSLTSRIGICVGPDGELYRCQRHMGNKAHTIGNVWSGRTESSFEKQFYEGGHFKECLSCIFLPLCLGGCPHFSVQGKQSVACSGFKSSAVMSKLQENGIDAIPNDYEVMSLQGDSLL